MNILTVDFIYRFRFATELIEALKCAGTARAGVPPRATLIAAADTECGECATRHESRVQLSCEDCELCDIDIFTKVKEKKDLD